MRAFIPSLARIVRQTLCIGALFAVPVATAQMPSGPGPEHKELKRLEGEWVAIIKSTEGDSKGTMTYRMECGGLWLASDFKAEFGGQPFHGRGMDGYDPQKKKFVSVWFDSMSTRPLVFEGEKSADGKTLTLLGEGPGPDGTLTKFKSVTQQVDADHEMFKMYTVGADGKATEMMTIEYARKK